MFKNFLKTSCHCEIASLVALARNDSLFLKDFERKYLRLETAELLLRLFIKH